MEIKKEDVVGIECRFAVHCPTPKGYRDDIHVVKEAIHLKDGKIIPNLRIIKNFTRPFWITKKAHQRHKDKKEWEYKENLNEYKTTQSELINNIAKAINKPWFRGSLRELCRSPYIYGADILSTSLIKYRYAKKYPNLQSLYSVACFDVETDVLHGTDRIIMATLSFKDRVVTAIDQDYLKGYSSNVVEQLHKKLNKYIGEYIEKRNIKWEVEIVDSEAKIIMECFKRAHQWKPDFVAIWNITFDMNKILSALQKADIDPKDVFSDPSVPAPYRFFRFKQGSNQKVTASGKFTPVKPEAQWHTVYCPSSFYFIDAMCAYKRVRLAEQDRPSYSLDSVLDDVLGIRKLSFKQAEEAGVLEHKLEWHIFMQEKYPLEYVVYNVFDCISMEELDEKTSDLSMSLPFGSKYSDFENYKSQPRRLVDDLHFYCLDLSPPRVIATTSDEMVSELDDSILDLRGWI